MTTSTSIGVARIGDERRRQIKDEGYTPEHDAEHNDASLLAAAACYLDEARRGPRRERVPDGWPWGVEDWKPSMHPERNLEKAGALIAAEIDRLARQLTR